MAAKVYISTYLCLPLEERQKQYQVMPRLSVFAEQPKTEEKLRDSLRNMGIDDEQIEIALEGLVLA
ncbi:MAG: hypothetical protein HYU39_02570 [Thaumarchaeota archaeon]|nr:hypothetical protein [Nitrososphaerota archaeon]